MNGNAAVYFVDRHIDEGRADKPAFVEVDGAKRSISYGDLAHQSALFAGALSRADIRRDERMAMIVLDQIEFPIAFWGALKAGVTPIPLNTLLSTEIYNGILKDSRPSCVMVSKELWNTVSPALADIDCIRHIVVIGDTPENTTNFDSFVESAHALTPIEASGDELAFWLYSSGSTGLPKGVRHLHGSLQATSDTFGQKVLGIKEDDVVYSAAKLFFAYGLGNAMSFPMSVGATTLLFANRPTPDAVTDIIESQKPTIFCGVQHCLLRCLLIKINDQKTLIIICVSTPPRARPYQERLANVGTRLRGQISLTVLAQLKCFISFCPTDLMTWYMEHPARLFPDIQ